MSGIRLPWLPVGHAGEGVSKEDALRVGTAVELDGRAP